MMNYPGVINQDKEIIKKLKLFEGGHIDGHAPQLSGKELNAYIAAGIKTEHEATSEDEALEKLKKGYAHTDKGRICQQGSKIST